MKQEQITPILPRLNGYARRLCHGNLAQAEDLVQDTVVRIIKSNWVSRFGDEPVHFSWAARILVNTFNNEYARTKLWHAYQSLMFDYADMFAEDQHGYADEVREALRTLPKAWRNVIELRLVQELSYKTIAETLDIPFGTVMSTISRAKTRMRESLKEYASEEYGMGTA